MREQAEVKQRLSKHSSAIEPTNAKTILYKALCSIPEEEPGQVPRGRQQQGTGCEPSGAVTLSSQYSSMDNGRIGRRRSHS